jgi:hypothetical protein
MMLTKRRILAASAITAAGIAVAGTGLGRHLLAGQAPAPSRLALSEADEATMRAAIEAYFPNMTVAGVRASADEAIHIIDRMLGSLFERERTLMLAALRSLEQWPRVSAVSLSSFAHLAVAQRQEVLRAFEQSSLGPRLLLAASVRQFVGMGVFEQAVVIGAIPYPGGCLAQPVVGQP